MFTLTDHTAGHSWDYNSERQLMTVLKLHRLSNPKNELTVTVNGVTGKVR